MPKISSSSLNQRHYLNSVEYSGSHWSLWQKKGQRLYLNPLFDSDTEGYYNLENQRFVGGLRKWIEESENYQVSVRKDAVAVISLQSLDDDIEGFFVLIDKK